MKITNADLATMVDATGYAISNLKCTMDCNLPPKTVPRKKWEAEDLENLTTWTAQLRAYRKLLRKLLAEEARR